MIVNQCVEQGICVALILSQNYGTPIRSSDLSEALSVSDSYLKKILRKLVLADIIVSSPGKDGGFCLNHPAEEISIYDIYTALEGEECELKMSGIGNRIFVDEEKYSIGETKVRTVFKKANEAFLEELKKLCLSDLISEERYIKADLFPTGNSLIKEETVQ